MNRTQKIIGSATLMALLTTAPLFASADSVQATSSTGVFINPSGIVRVIGADVTAIGNGFVDAATTFGNTVVNWVVNISAATKIGANGSSSASTTDIKVGDKISFTGALSSAGSVMTVAASKIRDITTFPRPHLGVGTVVSVNAAAGSFVVSKGDHTVTVQTTASTTVSVNGSASSLSSLQAGDKVGVVGSTSTDGSVVTATKIVANVPGAHKSDTDNDNERGEGASVHGGAGLRLFGGLHLGEDK